MTEITRNAANAFISNYTFKSANTVVEDNSLILHGSRIAVRIKNKGIYLNNCDYPTNTAKARLNGVLTLIQSPYRIKQIKGQWFMVSNKDKIAIKDNERFNAWTAQPYKK